MKPVTGWGWSVALAAVFATAALWWPGTAETFGTADARIGPGGVDIRPSRLLFRRQWGVFGYLTASEWRDGPDAPRQRLSEWHPASLSLTALTTLGLLGFSAWVGRQMASRRPG